MSILNSGKNNPLSRYDGKIYFGERSYFLSIVPLQDFTIPMANGNCYLVISTAYIYIIHGYKANSANKQFLEEMLEDGHVFVAKFYTNSRGKIKEGKKERL